MHLCIVANPTSIHTQRWVHYFSDRGHNVHLIGQFDSRPPIRPGVILHRVCTPIQISKVRVLALAWEVRRLVRKIQPDVLHAYQVSPGGWLAAMSGYHPLAVTAWGSDLLIRPHYSRLYHLLTRWTLKQADHVSCVSQELAREAQAMGADPARLEVAPWGIDTEIFHPPPPGTRLHSQHNPGSGPLVVSIRAMQVLYNPLDLALAIPLVLRQVPDAQFAICTYNADAELLGQYRDIVEKHGAARAVRYVGPLPDDHAIADLYHSADVAVSIPSSDGMPLSVLEALSCGTALVLSDLPSLREWVREGQEGLFVPLGDVHALSAAIVRLLTDHSLRQRLQNAGTALVRERADKKVWMAHAEEMYYQLAQQMDCNS